MPKEEVLNAKDILASLKSRTKLVVSAPGRLDFLNTHQDYKGLPVVSLAVDKRLHIFAIKSDAYCFGSINLDKRECFDSDGLYRFSGSFSDYLKAALKLFRDDLRLELKMPYEFVISSEIPIGAGLGSSGALLVAFIKALSLLFKKKLSPTEVAELAYRAEREILGIPCGRLDQYSSALGGVLYMTMKPPIKYRRLSFPRALNILVVDSGIQHRTKNVHSERQEELKEAIRAILSQNPPQELRRKLSERLECTLWGELREEDLTPYLERIPFSLANRLRFTLRMNQLTQIAVKILSGESLGFEDRDLLRKFGIEGNSKISVLCQIVDKQHELLRDLYEVSLPRIEEIISAVKSVGNLVCAKISGAGLGGAIIVLSKGNLGIIRRKALDSGATKVFEVKVDEGVKIEEF